jgi:hypothetical protein
MEISYRDGKKEDCKDLAELANIASEGVIEFLKSHELIPHEGGCMLMKCIIER